jgi:acid phosphatase (class A)
MSIIARTRMIGVIVSFLVFAVLPASEQEVGWTATADLPISALLLPPPCDKCAVTKAELDELREWQRSRTPELATHAQADYEKTLARFLDDPGIGLPTSQLQSCTQCTDFFARLERSVEAVNTVAKNKFRRTRPYKLPHNGLNPLKQIKADDSSSYPSGHAAFATVVGIVLSQVIPEKRTEIFKRVEDFCRSRLIAGVHFRSDVYAGQILGSAVAASLFRDEGFIRDFETTKMLLRKTLGL